MFFVLSGFLIGGILIKEYIHTRPKGLESHLHFWKRRWFRTLPNYYLVLLLNLLFAGLGWNNGDIGQASWQFPFFLHNLAWPFQGFFWESWSLSVEEWFYLLFPLGLVFFSGIGRTGERSRKLGFELAILVFLAVPLIFRILHFDPKLDGYQLDIQVRKVVVMRLDAIAMGIALAYWHHFGKASFQRWRYVLGLAGFILFICMTQYHAPKSSAYAQFWSFSLSPLSYALMLPFLFHLPKPSKWLSLPVEHVSKVSYSLYLVHLGLVLEPMLKHFEPKSALSAWLSYGIFLIISLSVASLLYYLWERPTTKLRDRNWRFGKD